MSFLQTSIKETKIKTRDGFVCNIDFSGEGAILVASARKELDLVDQKIFYVRLGEVLRGYREEKLKITQEEFASRVGLSRPSIANIEKGRQQLSVLQLVIFSGVIGVPVERLIPSQGGISNPPLSSSLPDTASHLKNWVDQL